MQVSMREIFTAYKDCRKGKRNTRAAMEIEADMICNLRELRADINSGDYRIGRTRCFAVTKPKAREVWAGAFRDRIVHHVMYNRLAPVFTPRFSADSSACIPGQGTLYGAQRLESQIRSVTENWSKEYFYLKLDISNFFVSIYKPTLFELFQAGITDDLTERLVHQILFHDPRPTAIMCSPRAMMRLIPKRKSLFNAQEGCGLPIGNLPSQFGANVDMNELDQFIKQQIRPAAYARYVDDFVLIHQSPQWLNDAQVQIEQFLYQRLRLQINPTKTILQPVTHGVDFVGHVIKPWHTVPRGRLRRSAMGRIEEGGDDVADTLTSYMGLMRQSRGYNSRAGVCRKAMKAGYPVSHRLHRVYPKPAQMEG